MKSRLTSRLGDLLLIITVVLIDLLVWGGRQNLTTGGEAPTWLVPIVDTAIVSTLWLRREYPLSIFALQWAYSLAGLVVAGYGPVAGLLVALYSVASSRPFQISAPALALCFIPALVDSVGEASSRLHTETPFQVSLTAILILYLVLIFAAWGLGHLTYAASNKARQILEQRVTEGRIAIQAERGKLARELHDIIAHSVTAIILQTASASKMINSDAQRAQHLLGNVENLGIEAMEELHRLLSVLRTVEPVSTDSSEAGSEGLHGLDDIGSLLSTAQASGVAVREEKTGQPRAISRSVGLAAYRVIQESLTNAAKHAAGGRAHVALRWGREVFTVEVRSSSPVVHAKTAASSSLSSGQGLRGLHERVTLVGGRLTSGIDGEDFVVAARFPISGALGTEAPHLPVG